MDVVRPVTCKLKPLELLATTCTLKSCGAAGRTVNCTAAGLTGVRSKPVAVAKAGLMLIEPDTEPVWSLMVVVLFGKIAWVVFAGIVKLTVLPPVANWTAGSGLKRSGFTTIVSVPVRGNE